MEKNVENECKLGDFEMGHKEPLIFFYHLQLLVS